MLSKQKKQSYYQALLERNPKYAGVFYVGVKTTGIFCHATCPARKPKFAHCEFFEAAKAALLAGYHPCQRCQPLLPPGGTSATIKKLIAAIEQNPSKRWKNQDFRELGVDESTARRQFKKRFGMTFIEYARARRMGLAMQQIKSGQSVIDTQFNIGYESDSGFRDAFSRIMGAAPTHLDAQILKAAWLDTVLGPMLAIADSAGLYLLEFVDRRGLEREVQRLRQRLKAAIIPGETKIIVQIRTELANYFSGKDYHFKTPVHLIGSDFQRKIWKLLQQIPVGETRSYMQIAQAIGQPKAYRAAARANGLNQLALIVPCHRVINANGQLSGYGGGVARKAWLLRHEGNVFNDNIVVVR